MDINPYTVMQAAAEAHAGHVAVANDTATTEDPTAQAQSEIHTCLSKSATIALARSIYGDDKTIDVETTVGLSGPWTDKNGEDRITFQPEVVVAIVVDETVVASHREEEILD